MTINDADYDLLSAYIDDMLTNSERAAFEARLDTDADLRRELTALRQTVALVKQLPTLKAPRNFTLTQAMVEEPSDVVAFPTQQRRSVIYPVVSVLSAVAALILVVFGVSILLIEQRSDQSEPIQVMVSEMSNTFADDMAVTVNPTAPQHVAALTQVNETHFRNDDITSTSLFPTPSPPAFPLGTAFPGLPTALDQVDDSGGLNASAVPDNQIAQSAEATTIMNFQLSDDNRQDSEKLPGTFDQIIIPATRLPSPLLESTQNGGTSDLSDTFATLKLTFQPPVDLPSSVMQQQKNENRLEFQPRPTLTMAAIARAETGNEEDQAETAEELAQGVFDTDRASSTPEIGSDVAPVVAIVASVVLFIVSGLSFWMYQRSS